MIHYTPNILYLADTKFDLKKYMFKATVPLYINEKNLNCETLLILNDSLPSTSQ